MTTAFNLVCDVFPAWWCLFPCYVTSCIFPCSSPCAGSRTWHDDPSSCSGKGPVQEVLLASVAWVRRECHLGASLCRPGRDPTSEIQGSICLAFSKTARSLLLGEQLQPAWAPSLAGLALFISSRKLMRGWADLPKYLRGRVNPGKELSCSGGRTMLEGLEQTGLTSQEQLGDESWEVWSCQWLFPNLAPSHGTGEDRRPNYFWNTV